MQSGSGCLFVYTSEFKRMVMQTANTWHDWPGCACKSRANVPIHWTRLGRLGHACRGYAVCQYMARLGMTSWLCSVPRYGTAGQTGHACLGYPGWQLQIIGRADCACMVMVMECANIWHGRADWTCMSWLPWLAAANYRPGWECMSWLCSVPIHGTAGQTVH
jgi:hypothetical protein